MNLPPAPASIRPILSAAWFQTLTSAILAAGAFIRTERRTFTRGKAELKGPNDLVSYVDRTVEEDLQRTLQTLLPESGFLMEESPAQHTERPAVWIVDPLDGTTNFVHGVPIYSISVALQVDGKLLLGVVYEVNNDELFYAAAGEGAFLNGMPIQVSPTTDLRECLLSTGFPFRDFDAVEEYLAMLRKFMRNTRGVRRLGSAAVDLAYTAAGRFDGFFESNLKPWDVAAGALLVQEAGGAVTDFTGGPNYLYGRMIAAGSSLIHRQMLDMMGQDA